MFFGKHFLVYRFLLHKRHLGLVFFVALTSGGRFALAQKPTKESSLANAQKIAQKYCQSCHSFPAPALLDKATWVNRVLPNMAWRLGLRPNNQDPYTDLPPEEVALIKAAGVYPETAAISEQDWQSIVQYYESLAPELPPKPTKSIEISDELPLFTVAGYKIHDKAISQTTLLKYQPSTALLYVGDAQKELYVLDSTLAMKAIWSLAHPATDIDFPPNSPPRLLTIGVFNPSEQRLGELFVLDTVMRQPYIPNLPRPVSFAVADLNQDGTDDFVVCNFGNHTGQLVWYESGDTTKKHVLKNLPGARKVEIVDLNNDQRPDIVALMAQAYESVVVFYNQGKGQFIEKTVLQFSPVFGASYFELADFNGDKKLDILLTNGDNWDFSSVPKAFHGVRIFLNNGKTSFNESWFFPLYGTSKAVARDFDHDGDLDIAAISFYDDLEKPEHSFVFLANHGNLSFTAHTTSQAASGKWLTMETGDFDHDGDDDIVLGSYFQNIGELYKLVAHGIMSFPQLLLFKNNLKK